MHRAQPGAASPSRTWPRLSPRTSTSTPLGARTMAAHTKARFGLAAQGALHTATAAKGPYMVGQGAFSVGIVGVLASGLVTSEHISKANLARAVMEMAMG